MRLMERIARSLRWPGWRRGAPVAGSVATHVVLGLAVVSMLAATSKPSRVIIPPSPSLEVTLIAETPAPPPGRRPTPPDAPKAPPRSEPRSESAEAPPVARDPHRDQKKPAAAQPKVAGGKPSEDEGGVYLGDTLAASGAPLGLRSLMEADPCKPNNGLPRGDCGPTWAQKFASNSFEIVPTEAQLKRMYPGIIPPCPYKVGCEGGEWISANGTRSVFNSRGSPMMGGAAGIGMGAESTVERLGFNPDHVDPGFGD